MMAFSPFKEGQIYILRRVEYMSKASFKNSSIVLLKKDSTFLNTSQLIKKGHETWNILSIVNMSISIANITIFWAFDRPNEPYIYGALGREQYIVAY